MVSLNTGKYLRYAIGEVILVVFGILIALQVNNWNEYRKEKIEEKKILLSLHNEISNNLESLKVVIKEKNNIIDINQYIINNTDKNREWKSTKSLDSLMNFISLSGWIFVPQNGVLNEIIKENREKVKYMLAELEPKDFINTWLKLVPYIIAMRHLQQFNVDELTKAETKELVKDIIENEGK